MTEEVNKNNSLVVIDNNSQFDEDFKIARDNIEKTINTANDALKEMIDIAKASQHPAAYDILNKMIKVSSDLSKDMLEIYKKKTEITNTPMVDKGQSGGEIINNNLFVGSTADLQNMIENMRKNRDV